MECKKVSFILQELLSCCLIFSLMESLTVCVIFPGVEDAVAAQQQEVVVVEHQAEVEGIDEAQAAVVRVVEAVSEDVLHQVHFTMEVNGTTQEQQVSRKRVHI